MSGFNTKNLGTYGRNNYAVGLGNAGSGFGSLSREYNFLARTTSDPLYELFNFSKPAKPVSVPSAPTNLSAIPGDQSVSISFTQSSNGGSPITNYEYIILDVSGVPTFISFSPPQTTSPVVLTGLFTNYEYSIRLRAVNKMGPSPSSNIFTFTIPEYVEPPTLVFALAGNEEAYVYFNQTGTATNYEYTIDDEDTWIPFSPTITTSPVAIRGLTNGILTTIKLRALNGSLASIASNEITVTPEVPSLQTATLYYDPNNSSSYSGSGTTVANIGSFGTFNGTKTSGVGYVTGSGITRNVFDFNGSNSESIEFSQYNFGSSFTVSAWVYPRSNFSINAILSNAFAGLDANGFKMGWNGWETENKAMLFEAGNGSSGDADLSVDNVIEHGTWQYLTYVFDQANSRVVFLKNGLPVTSASYSDSITVNNIGVNNEIFKVGCFVDGSYPMNAQLGYIKVYSGILSVGEIQEDYDASKSSFTSISLPLAPVLTGVSFKTTDSMTITFTQETNGITITNYKYSLNGGPYTALSPVDVSSPITISGLTPNTSYNITLKAVSVDGDSNASNTLSETTYANVNYDTFTNVGTSSWTAPAGVTFVQYLIVGGGGGGGATYSKINVLGDILVTDTPQVEAYWINSANLTNGRYSGRMYYGLNSGQNSSSFSDPIRLTASQDFTPAGVTYPYNKWYNTELVYSLTGALVNTTNYFSPYIINSTYCNNISGGSGGGCGGQVKVLSGTNKYDVIPGTTYTVIVGDGGEGGIGGSNTETNGSPGGDSSFDTIISLGGSGGSYSRNGGNNVDTSKFGKGGQGGQTSGNFVGGSGGNSTFNSNYGRYNSGGPGANGTLVNFDGTGNVFYGAGGTGGVPNTVATGTTVANVGKGGEGTGATLNSYANGIDGGSGIVILKYYT